MGKKKEQKALEASKRYYVRQALKSEETNYRGLLIEAVCCVPPETEQTLNAVGLASPQPIVGLMLIDTGAGQISISTDVVGELRLQRVGEETGVHGLGGPHSLGIHNGRVLIPCVNARGDQKFLDLRVPVRSLDHFNTSPEFQGLYNAERQPARMLGILGRAFLQLGKLTYDGPNATYRIDIEDDLFSRSAIVIGPNGRVEN
jgi:hypothetical protein